MKKQLKSFKKYATRQWGKLFGNSKLQELGSAFSVICVALAFLSFIVGANILLAWVIQTVLAAFGKQVSLFICWLIALLIYWVLNVFGAAIRGNRN